MEIRESAEKGNRFSIEEAHDADIVSTFFLTFIIIVLGVRFCRRRKPRLLFDGAVAIPSAYLPPNYADVDGTGTLRSTYNYDAYLTTGSRTSDFKFVTSYNDNTLPADQTLKKSPSDFADPFEELETSVEVVSTFFLTFIIIVLGVRFCRRRKPRLLFDGAVAIPSAYLPPNYADVDGTGTLRSTYNYDAYLTTGSRTSDFKFVTSYNDNTLPADQTLKKSPSDFADAFEDLVSTFFLTFIIIVLGVRFCRRRKPRLLFDGAVAIPSAYLPPNYADVDGTGTLRSAYNYDAYLTTGSRTSDFKFVTSYNDNTLPADQTLRKSPSDYADPFEELETSVENSKLTSYLIIALVSVSTFFLTFIIIVLGVRFCRRRKPRLLFDGAVAIPSAYLPPNYADVDGTGTLRSTYNYDAYLTTGSRTSDFKFVSSYNDSTLPADQTLKKSPSDFADPFEDLDATGDLTAVERIDRESLCGKKPSCVIIVDLVLENPLELHRVSFHIQDVNDNSPKFRENLIEMEISESADKGNRFSIEEAHDADIGQNAVQRYSLQKNDNFILAVGNVDGTGTLRSTYNYDAYLTTGSQTIDFKFVTSYNDNTLPADQTLKKSPSDFAEAFGGCDASPAKDGLGLSSYTKLTVDVTDVNDNTPVIYVKSLANPTAENVSPGTEVGIINVQDADSDSNQKKNSKLTSYLIIALVSVSTFFLTFIIIILGVRFCRRRKPRLLFDGAVAIPSAYLPPNYADKSTLYLNRKVRGVTRRAIVRSGPMSNATMVSLQATRYTPWANSKLTSYLIIALVSVSTFFLTFIIIVLGVRFCRRRKPRLLFDGAVAIPSAYLPPNYADVDGTGTLRSTYNYDAYLTTGSRTSDFKFVTSYNDNTLPADQTLKKSPSDFADAFGDGDSSPENSKLTSYLIIALVSVSTFFLTFIIIVLGVRFCRRRKPRLLFDGAVAIPSAYLPSNYADVDGTGTLRSTYNYDAYLTTGSRTSDFKFVTSYNDNTLPADQTLKKSPSDFAEVFESYDGSPE
ncbi:hypothetical protein INR49_028111, partial [Caranx melampygus]